MGVRSGGALSPRRLPRRPRLATCLRVHVRVVHILPPIDGNAPSVATAYLYRAARSRAYHTEARSFCLLLFALRGPRNIPFNPTSCLVDKDVNRPLSAISSHRCALKHVCARIWISGIHKRTASACGYSAVNAVSLVEHASQSASDGRGRWGGQCREL